MNLLKAFQQYILKENLFQQKEHLLLAVSGGVDSVVLCELCKQAGYDFVIAHCNFQLRAAESDGDADFVNQLSEHYNVKVFIKQFETEKYAVDNKLSIQVAARDLRYAWFKTLLSNGSGQPLNLLLTAHHADDNIETILMNFFKGSGINGLKGILPRQNNIVRPLLFAKKEELLSFATSNNLAYREDSSNSSNKYTRNYFRNELIPALEKVFPEVKDNIIDNSLRFREINILYSQSIAANIKKLVSFKGKELHIPVLKLLKTEALYSVLYEIIKGCGFSPHQVDEVVKLLHSTSGKYVQSGTHRILKNRNWLIIAPLNEVDLHHYLIEESNKHIHFSAGELLIEGSINKNEMITDKNVAMMDASQIKFPLLLRKWKQGDYFYPLGMKKKKKLSRFFIDQKLSMNEKENSWVIESNKKIIWVVGKRIDDRVKLSGNTTEVLKVILVNK